MQESSSVWAMLKSTRRRLAKTIQMALAGLALPLAAAAAEPAKPDWVDQVKHPTAWLSWGAAMRLRQESFQNAYTLDNEGPNNVYSYQRYRFQVWNDLKPLPPLTLNTRLAWEFRTYQQPESKEGPAWDEILIDHLNLSWTNVLGKPLALTVGRQDLTFGDRWLVWDGTGPDASRTEFFDAGRLTWDWKEAQTRVDAVYFDLHHESDYWLPVISPTGASLTEQDERGGILYLSNRSLARTQLDAYLIYRHEYDPQPVVGDQGDLYVTGARAAGDLSEHWKYRSEFAAEFGRKNDRGLNAFGFNGRLSYFFKDAWNHNVRLGYEYLSGDDPGTASDEGWDPMWGRRAQWSELLTFTFTTEGNGRKSDWNNLQRIDAGWSCNPTRSIEVLVDYMPLFANDNPLGGTSIFNGDGSFRGHLAAAVLKFRFSKRVTGHLWSEFFFPGNYYQSQNRDAAAFLRAELTTVF